MKYLLSILFYLQIINLSKTSLIFHNINRRNIIEYSSSSLLSSNNIFRNINKNNVSFFPKKKLYSKTNDWYSHWSFFGIAPPPIKSSITYEELINEINNNNIYSLQIAVQHDCIIATTNNGYRLSCLVPDEKFNDLYTDAMNSDGQLKVLFLPIDETKSNIRKTAQISFYSLCMYYLLSELNIIDVDTTPYSSIKERDDARNSGKPPKKIIGTIKDTINFIILTQKKNHTKSNF